MAAFSPKAATMRAMSDAQFMRLALRLARRGYGMTSPNPMVGAVLVKGGKIIGRGWHRRAGLPHAEIEALHDAQKHGHNPKGATLYVTLEPCSTHGRTPPCTDAIIAAGIKRVVIGTTDPNPKHSGRAFKILRRAGIEVTRRERRHPAAPDRHAPCSGRLARRDAGAHQYCRRMRAAQRSVQSLDCSSHTIRHGKGRDDAGRQNRHGHRRIEMDYRRKGARFRNETAAGQPMRFWSASTRFWRTIRA